MVFFPICTFTLYQFTLDDAWLPIFLAAITLFITVATLLLAEGSLLLAARRSHDGSNLAHQVESEKQAGPDHSPSSSTTAAVRPVAYSLWSPFPNLRPLCSALYQQYRRPMYTFWLLPLLFGTFAKACFIAFAHKHGLVQLIAFVIIEGLTFIVLVAFRPHTNKKGDWLSAVLSLFRLVGTGIMFAFFSRVGASGIVRTVMGLVSVAIWGFAVITLLIGFFVNACKSLSSPYRLNSN